MSTVINSFHEYVFFILNKNPGDVDKFDLITLQRYYDNKVNHIVLREVFLMGKKEGK